MEKIYRCPLGSRVKYSSAFYIALIIGLAVMLALVYEGGYISAWFITIILAVVALMVLSIPRRVVIDEEGIEIKCISDNTFLPYETIATVRKVERREMSACLPIFAAVGFFGFYGRYLNIRTMEFIHIYASQWDNFVEITDVDGDKYYISLPDAEDMITRVEGFIKPHDTRENI